MGHIGVTELLLMHNANPLATERNNGWMPLTLACRINYWKILQHLLDKLPVGTDLTDLIDYDGWNLLHHTVAMKRTPDQSDQETTMCLFKLLNHAIKYGNSFDVNKPTSRVKMLATMSSKGFSDQSIASISTSTDYLLALSELKINLNDKFVKPGDAELDLTPLHLAASNGLLKHVELLVDVNANIKAKCKLVTNPNWRVKPIYLAAIYDDYAAVVSFLLRREADAFINEQSKNEGKKPPRKTFMAYYRHLYDEYISDKSKPITDFQEAVYRGHTKVVKAFLQYPAIMKTGLREFTSLELLVSANHFLLKMAYALYKAYLLLILYYTILYIRLFLLDLCIFLYQGKLIFRFWESRQIRMNDIKNSTNNYNKWEQWIKKSDNAVAFELHFKRKYVSHHQVASIINLFVYALLVNYILLIIIIFWCMYRLV